MCRIVYVKKPARILWRKYFYDNLHYAIPCHKIEESFSMGFILYIFLLKYIVFMDLPNYRDLWALDKYDLEKAPPTSI